MSRVEVNPFPRFKIDSVDVLSSLKEGDSLLRYR